jgi:hypothetical protein
MGYIAEAGSAAYLQAKFSRVIHLLLMLRGCDSRNLASIANLIGERGERAKQPLPRFFGCQLMAFGLSACATEQQIPRAKTKRS